MVVARSNCSRIVVETLPYLVDDNTDNGRETYHTVAQLEI